MRRRFRRLILPCVAALAAGASTLACGADAVTGPPRTPPPRTHHVTGQPPLGQFVSCTKREHQFASATIGPRGGTLVVGSNMLIVPPGALLTETLITADVPEGSVAAIHFQPSGLQFRKPAALLLDAVGCNLPDVLPDVVYFDDSGAVLERIQAVYSRWLRRVIAPISHFSGYAIAV